MARLTKTELIAVSVEWLAGWHAAGKPTIGSIDTNKQQTGPFSIMALGSVRQTYGYGTRLIIGWQSGGPDVTHLVAWMQGYRLCKHRTIVCRSGCVSESIDKGMLRNLAVLTHEKAALVQRDGEALRATNPLLAAEKEAEWLAESVAASVASAKRGRRRL